MNSGSGYFGLVFSVLLLLTTGAQAGTPYAPVLDSGKASGNKYLQTKLIRAEKNLPKSSEVPVSPYQGSSIFSIADISSVSESQYQMNGIVFLSTPDSQEQVLNFYQDELDGWKHQRLKNGDEVMLEKGDQLFWGGNKFLEASRVVILDISGATPASTSNVDILKLKESFPEMATVIKVYYEKSVEDLLAVDTEKLVAGCVAHEVESKGKLMGANTEDQAAVQYLQNMAKNSCAKVEKACAKDTNGRRCQRYARLYP